MSGRAQRMTRAGQTNQFPFEAEVRFSSDGPRAFDWTISAGGQPRAEFTAEGRLRVYDQACR